MKKLILSIYFLSIFFTINAQHRKEYYPGGYWITNANLQSGDTMHLNKGVYTYISGENLNNITILPDAGTELRSGINLRNSSNIHIAGLDKSGNHNLFIHDASGVAIEATGKCNNWEIDGVDMYNVYSWIWFKTEPDDFKLTNGQIDSSYWSIVMTNLYVHDCNWKKANFDGGYIGTTDAKADRGFVINNKTYFPYPPMVARIKFKNLILDTSYRTNLQVSVLVDSVTLDNVTAKNAGINSYLDADGKNQGANFIIGGSRNSIYASITNSTFKNSNLYNIRTQAGGTIRFNNNTTDSATAVYRIGQGVGINSQQMASVEFDNPIPTLIDFENNNLGYSNNNVGFVAYGKAVTGSKFANNKLKGLFQNFTGTIFDTTGNIIKDTTHQDTTKTVWQYTYKDSLTTHDTVINSTCFDTSHILAKQIISNCKTVKVKTRIWFWYTYTNVTTCDTLNIAAHDSISSYPCFKLIKTTHDSVYIDSIKVVIIQQPKAVTNVGIMPFNVANTYNSNITRDEINYQYWQQQLALIARIKSYNQDSVIININNKNADLSPAKFVHDTISYKQNLIAIQKATGIKTAVIENENDSKDFDDSVSNYINEVTAAVHALQPLGVTVYNGGFIKIRFWYYMKTHDADFLNTCIPSMSKGALLRGDLKDDSASVQKQINAFKNLKGFAFNTHQLYVTDVSEFPGLHRMIEYFNKETGGNVASNEAGSYSTDPAIVKGLVQLARDEKMQWMILYSGDGSSKSLPISLSAFNSALK